MLSAFLFFHLSRAVLLCSLSRRSYSGLWGLREGGGGHRLRAQPLPACHEGGCEDAQTWVTCRSAVDCASTPKPYRFPFSISLCWVLLCSALCPWKWLWCSEWLNFDLGVGVLSGAVSDWPLTWGLGFSPHSHGTLQREAGAHVWAEDHDTPGPSPQYRQLARSLHQIRWAEMHK